MKNGIVLTIIFIILLVIIDLGSQIAQEMWETLFTVDALYDIPVSKGIPQQSNMQSEIRGEAPAKLNNLKDNVADLSKSELQDTAGATPGYLKDKDDNVSTIRFIFELILDYMKKIWQKI